jgi:ParB family chromosome partitioning protein
MKRIVEIELSFISPNRRIILSEETVIELCRHLSTHTHVEPIVVYFEGGMFRILDGEKRWRAMRRLGMRKARVVLEGVGT